MEELAVSTRSILAAYVGDVTGASGLKLAIHMARKYEAWLTVVFWHGHNPLQSRYQGYMTDNIMDIFRQRDAELVESIRADFTARVRAADLQDRAEFIDIGSSNDFSLSECARSHDVVVMPTGAADLGAEHYNARPDVVAMRGGRPVILVPPAYEVPQLGEHAVVAWDGKRASARALGDAMNILETKEKVTVLTVGEPLTPRPGADVMQLLRRHGLEAEYLVRPVSRSGISRTIIDTCEEVGAGLLIMGAYEHSMMREELMGGVTHDIVKNATIPVLMSH